MAAQGVPAGLGQSQRERLAYIDFRLYSLGEVSRTDITARFCVAPAGATRDLAIYREFARDNISFDGSTKTYRISPGFSPLFDRLLERALSALSQGFGDGLGSSRGGLVACEFPEPINQPAIEALATVTRAALAGYVMRRWSVDYSPDHSFRGPEHHLWLRDPLVLYGVERAALAPGYTPSGEKP